MSGADGGGGGQSSKSRPVSAEEGAVGAAANPTRSGQVGKQECSRPRISSRPQSSLERVSPVCLLLFFSLTFSSHPFPLTAPSPFNSLCVCVFAFSLSLSSFAFKFSHFFSIPCPDFPSLPSSFSCLISPFCFPSFLWSVASKGDFSSTSSESKRLLGTHKSKCCCVRTCRSAPDGHNLFARLSDVSDNREHRRRGQMDIGRGLVIQMGPVKLSSHIAHTHYTLSLSLSLVAERKARVDLRLQFPSRTNTQQDFRE